MSMLFTGEVAVPNIAAGIDKLAPVLQNAGALELKKRKAQAAAIKADQDNRAKITGQMAGLYSDSHPFASQYMDQATDELTGLLTPYLSIPGGSEYSKQIIGNWKLSAEAYNLNPLLTAEDRKMGAMVDPASQVSRDYNESLGSMYNASVSLNQHAAARLYQYEGLADEVEVVLNPSSPGSWALMGYELNANGERVGEDKIDLKNMEFFNNDQRAFTPETVMVTDLTAQEVGEGMRVSEKGGAGRVYDAAKVTELFAGYWRDPLEIKNMEDGNAHFGFRRMAMLEGEDYIRSSIPAARDLSQEELLEFFALTPKMKEKNDVIFKGVKNFMEDFWINETLPHVKYPDDGGTETDMLALFEGSVATGYTETELPTNITTSADGTVRAGEVVEGLVYPDFVTGSWVKKNGDVTGTVDADGNLTGKGKDGGGEFQPKNPDAKLRTVSYPVVNMPSKSMENVKFPAYNEAYYKKMDLFASMKLVKYNPITREPYPVQGKLGKNDATAQAVVDLFATQSPVKSESIQDVIMYEGNPGIFSVKTDGGGLVTVDINNLNAYTQSVYSAVKIGLAKSGLDISDLYGHSNEIDWSEGANPAVSGFDPNDYEKE